jgi:hypothetical protein
VILLTWGCTHDAVWAFFDIRKAVLPSATTANRVGRPIHDRTVGSRFLQLSQLDYRQGRHWCVGAWSAYGASKRSKGGRSGTGSGGNAFVKDVPSSAGLSNRQPNIRKEIGRC